MSKTLSLVSVQPILVETIEAMDPGEELVLTRNDEPVAMLTRTPRTSWPCEPGIALGRPFWMAPDFDAPLDDFREA